MPAVRGESVVIDSAGGLIVKEKDFVVVCATLSVTRAVKFDKPATVGVPLMVPPDESVSPAGSDPDTDQEYGGVPPVADKSWEYGAPIVPVGRGDVVTIESCTGLIVSEKLFFCVREALSLT
jgi:hypothetical protein